MNTKRRRKKKRIKIKINSSTRKQHKNKRRKKHNTKQSKLPLKKKKRRKKKNGAKVILTVTAILEVDPQNPPLRVAVRPEPSALEPGVVDVPRSAQKLPILVHGEVDEADVGAVEDLPVVERVGLPPHALVLPEEGDLRGRERRGEQF